MARTCAGVAGKADLLGWIVQLASGIVAEEWLEADVPRNERLN